jgi:ATP synthase protein I
MSDRQSEQERLTEEISSKAERKMRARRQQDRGVWFGLGMFGLVGWAVAVPTLLGITVGVWLDRQFPGKPSWTLTLLFLGVILGCINAWYWVRRESGHDDEQFEDQQSED